MDEKMKLLGKRFGKGMVALANEEYIKNKDKFEEYGFTEISIISKYVELSIGKIFPTADEIIKNLKTKGD